MHSGETQGRCEQSDRLGGQVEPRCVGSAHDGRSRSSGSVARPNSSTMTSKVQRSPRWLQKMSSPSMSKGVAAKRSATPGTSAGVTKRKRAAGSTKRRMSQGQAVRSIFGRDLVTQSVAPSSSRCGMWFSGTRGSRAARQPENPPSRISADTPSARSEAATPFTSSVALSAVDHCRLAEESGTPFGHDFRGLAPRAGQQAGIGRSILVRSHIDQNRRVRPANELEKPLAGENVWSWHGRVLAYLSGAGRDALAVASWGDRRPHSAMIARRAGTVNPGSGKASE